MHVQTSAQRTFVQGSRDRKSTRLNSSHLVISYAVFCLKKKYQQVIPKDNDKYAIADKLALTGALKRMSVIASDQTHRIRLSFNQALLRFSVQTPDLGEATDELPVRYTGDPIDIGFNANYLLEILRYLPTDEVKITMKAPERAATLEPEGWSDPSSYLTLVMPLRLVD